MATGREALPLVRIGAWETLCCHLDLYSIESADDVERVSERLLDDEPPRQHVWATRDDALDEISRRSWTPSDEGQKELAAMRRDPTLCGSVAIAQAVKS